MYIIPKKLFVYNALFMNIVYKGETMINVLKGVLIGIGKIIPGVSGSLIAMSLGIYEKCIDIISNFFIEIKYNYKFIFCLCLGFLISMICFSNILYYFITNHYFVTMCLFVGLIIATVPDILKENKIKYKKDYIYILVSFFVIVLISIFGKNTITIENNIVGYLLTILIGFIDAVTMIVPGVSGTAIFMILGVYEFVLILFSKMLFPFIIFFVIGLIIGVFITCKIINYCFKNFNYQTYLVILGLVLGSSLFLIINVFSNSFGLIQLVLGIILFVMGYFISHFFGDK